MWKGPRPLYCGRQICANGVHGRSWLKRPTRCHPAQLIRSGSLTYAPPGTSWRYSTASTASTRATTSPSSVTGFPCLRTSWTTTSRTRAPAEPGFVIASTDEATVKDQEGQQCHEDLRDHPRACGADRERPQGEPRGLGPSPRVRGRLRGRHHVRVVIGTIPARAGPTRPRCPPHRRSRDHPRACGADLSYDYWCKGLSGPSPRVRGRPSASLPDGLGLGTIPARAGPTQRAPRIRNRPRDHPRACGADARAVNKPGTVMGPSPRVRGRPFVTCCFV